MLVSNPIGKPGEELATEYLAKKRLQNSPPNLPESLRIDSILIDLGLDNKVKRIEHIENIMS